MLIDKRIGDVRFQAISLAGEETMIALPELNVCFDFGRAPRPIIGIDTVCLSHGHMDHSAGIAYYCSQRAFLGSPPGTIVLPRELVPLVRDLLAVWARIEGKPSAVNLIGLAAGQEHVLRKGLLVRTFPVNHGGPCLGYTVIEVRNKLKPEYADHTGPMLVELKKKGVQIEYRLEVPLVAYCGDTAVGEFFDLDHVRNSKVIILDCTFFDPEHVVRARAGRHMHVQDLPEALDRLRNRHVVLSHLSRRTFIRDAKKILRETVGENDLERLTFLMDRPPRQPSPSS